MDKFPRVGQAVAKVVGEHNLFLAKEITFVHLSANAGCKLASFLGLRIQQEIATRKALFVHVPRTAGSSIAVGLYGRKISHHSAAYFKSIDPNGFDSCYKFAFVRNPWDRLVSSYHLLKKGGSDIVRVWDAHKYHQLGELTFDEFVQDWLWKRRSRLMFYDTVLWPQTWFTHSRNGRILLLDFVGRLEKLDEDLRYLNSTCGIFVNRLHLNRSIDRQAVDYRVYYSQQKTIDMVAEIYETDVRNFAYDFDRVDQGLVGRSA
jgi:hypothetical protein